MMNDHIAALIMAGGRSDRMRAGACSKHKSLRQVLGETLIERNLQALLWFGFRNVFVAVSANETELIQWVTERSLSFPENSGARLTPIIEEGALGTIGAVSRLPCSIRDALIINVDNLTDLDLNAFLRFHLERQPAATIAAHDEPFRIPFGRLEIEDEIITRYEEKPEILVTISSGTYVLNRRAMERVDAGMRTDVPELVRCLLEANELVLSYRHCAHWIDINDEATLAAAEALFEARLSEWPMLRSKATVHTSSIAGGTCSSY